MKFKIGDRVDIVSKSLGKSFMSLKHREGVVEYIYGRGDGSDENNCIMVDGNWFAPQDLRLSNFTSEIEQMFDELIEDL